MTFRSVMGNHKSAEVFCLYRGELVRRLTVDGDVLHFDAITEACDIPLDTEIKYEPWCMDRGSLVFSAPGLPHGITVAKFCTEHDVIKFDDGTTGHVDPHHAST